MESSAIFSASLAMESSAIFSASLAMESSAIFSASLAMVSSAILSPSLAMASSAWEVATGWVTAGALVGSDPQAAMARTNTNKNTGATMCFFRMNRNKLAFISSLQNSRWIYLGGKILLRSCEYYEILTDGFWAVAGVKQRSINQRKT